jgi:hypothetical protein
VDDTPATWADYIAWAAGQIGGVAALARRSGLHRDTLFNWKSGENAHTPTIKHIFDIADAVGDDRRRALLAAAQLPETADSSLAAAPRGPEPAEPTLAEHLRRINERIGEISAMTWLPLSDRLEAISAQQELADRLVRMYREPPADDTMRQTG